jgi:hypothetical protein
MIRIRSIAAVGLILMVAACAHLGSGLNRSKETLGAFDAARREIESRRGPIEAIWLGTGLDPQVQRVLVEERQAVDNKQPAGTVVAVPERHFMVESFVLEATRGRLAGVLGPRSSPVTMAACGMGFTVNLDRREGTWRAQVASVTVC